MADLSFKRKFGYEEWPEEKIKKVFGFAEEYRKFISGCKTERKVVEWVEEKAKEVGYGKLESVGGTKGAKRAKVYGINRGKAIILGQLGVQPLKKGARLVLAHIDSPRIDLKLQPLYEEEKIAFLKTQYYGGIKKYQWPAIPLAIYGVVVLENGKKVEIALGDQAQDQVLSIIDLLPHLAQKQMEKKLSEAIEGEELNIVVGSIPAKGTKETKETKKPSFAKASEGKDETVKLAILEWLNKKYGIKEEDFVSADLEIVPAGEAKDLGFDRSMIGGYGQDDRICAYTAVQSLFSIKNPQYSNLVVLVDKEETGSESNTGALSNFIPDFISEMLYLQTGKHDENTLRDCLSLSKAISADVTVAFDPDHKDVFDPKNTARIGAGIALEKYTGRRGKLNTNEATAEFLAEIRRIFNQNQVLWQIGGLGKVDLGGGGTIAMFLARYNMDVVDAGPALLSMHSPFEISSKVDLYATFEAYRVFLSA